MPLLARAATRAPSPGSKVAPSGRDMAARANGRDMAARASGRDMAARAGLRAVGNSAWSFGRLELSAPEAPPAVRSMLNQPGEPLGTEARAVFEPRFGRSLTEVRIYDDAQSDGAAAAIGARAFASGHRIGFARGEYAPGTLEGQRLLAHELAHVAQQDQTVRRTVTATTAAGAGEVAGHLNVLCPGSFGASGTGVTVNAGACVTGASNGCDCACVAAQDSARVYTVDVLSADQVDKTETLWDGSTAQVPESSFWPNTVGGGTPSVKIQIPKASSPMLFGAFTATGTPFYYPIWRILAHELCGHGVLGQTYSGSAGTRPGHDVTIDTENRIAAEHSGIARGHFADPRQGEAFFVPAGPWLKVGFYQTNGLHYEAP